LQLRAVCVEGRVVEIGELFGDLNDLVKARHCDNVKGEVRSNKPDVIEVAFAFRSE
jgi:hypothetical protein